MSDNPQLDLARRYVEHTSVSLFLTGKAGTGKTTFLRRMMEECGKRKVVLAPTGVAAINAGGVTIHSFFQLPFDPYLPDVPELITEYQMPKHKGLTRNKLNIIRTLELLIIDEVSMVRCDLLDAVDAALRRYRHSSRPFGGVQLLLIGDVHQLSPVVSDRERPYLQRVYPSPYFFCSKALQRVNYITLELTHIYRQQDANFVHLLNKVREGAMDASVLRQLNERVGTAPDDTITLTTHNRQADAINNRHMAALRGKERTFKAVVTGNFAESNFPVERELTLKVGERVMFVRNDSTGQHRYYNGLIGTIEGFVDENGQHHVKIRTDDGTTILLGQEQWENLRYEMGANNQIVQQVEGTFNQVPLRPAWAVTIHKAQGLTFDRVAVNAADAFAFGQLYVALSRCRTLEGLTLTTPISASAVFGDQQVQTFVSSRAPFETVASQIDSYENEYYFEQLLDLFGLETLQHTVERLDEPYSTHLRNIYPNRVLKMHEAVAQTLELQGVAERFARQLRRLPIEQHPDRIAKASAYYLDRLVPLRSTIDELADISIDNKEHSRIVADRSLQVDEILKVKIACLRAVQKKGFDVAAVQKARVDALVGPEPKAAQPTKSKTAKQKSPLEKALTNWRTIKANEQDKKPFQILTQKALMGIVENRPRTKIGLLAIAGIGPTTVSKYGSEILQIVDDFRG